MFRSSEIPSSRRGWLLSTVAALVLVGGCSCAPPCKPGYTDVCYPGPEGTAGIGLCRSGIEQCLGGRITDVCQGAILPSEELCDGADNDCDGQTDEEVRNACGGCALLEGTPGETCAPCAKWECRGLDLVTCPPPAQTIGAECENDSGCPGTIRCQSDGTLRCAGPRANECGVCGGSAVPDLGSFCTDGECPGVFVCDGLGQSATCRTAPRNNCGVCNAPDVEFIGDSCAPTVPGDCVGTYECNEAGDDKVCKSPLRNACGACNAPAITDLGDVCEAFGCPGTRVCNALGTGTFCQPDPGCVITAGHVVISEVAGGGVNSDDDFVELYNPTAAPVDISTWTLWYTSASATSVTLSSKLIEFPADTVMPPRTYLLIGRGPGRDSITAQISTSLGYRWDSTKPTTAPDFVTATNAPNMAGATGTGGHVYLTSSPERPGVESGSTVAPRLDLDLVDLVGWGAAGAEREGTAPAPKAPSAAGSIERKATEGSTSDSMSAGGPEELLGNGFDSNDNSRDWLARSTRDPQNASAAVEPGAPAPPPSPTP